MVRISRVGVNLRAWVDQLKRKAQEYLGVARNSKFTQPLLKSAGITFEHDLSYHRGDGRGDAFMEP